MKNLPLIKGHAQALLELIEQCSNSMLITLLVAPLDGALNSQLLKDVVPVSFAVSDDTVAEANEAETKRKQARNSA